MRKNTMGGLVIELLMRIFNYPWLDPRINPSQGTLKRLRHVNGS